MLIDNMACVVTWFDDDHTMPGDYVLKWSDGFEAFVCERTAESVQGEPETFDSLSLGKHSTLFAATSIIWQWRELDRVGRVIPGTDGFDFNDPIKH